MRDVCSPPESLLMRNSMRPIPGKVNCDKAKDKRPPSCRDFERGDVVEEQCRTKSGQFDHRTDAYIDKTNSGCCKEIFGIV